MGDELHNTSCGFLVPGEDIVQQVAELYEKNLDYGFNTQSWDYRVAVIEVAKRMFGRRLDGFFGCQYEGRRLHGYRLDFLKGTLSFIETGKRTVSVDNWYELLIDYPTKDSRSRKDQVDAAQSLTSFKHILTNPDYIAQWCSHEKGFEDMLCTLSIIAGVMRSTA